MTDDEPLQVATEGAVRTLTLNRPEKRNALNPPLVAALLDALDDAAADDGVRCVVLTGAGKAFCAGGDIQDMLARRGDPLATHQRQREGFARLCHALHDLEKPTVAKVNGDAFGAGLMLALACDLAYAAADARFGATFRRVGLAPDTGASWLLPRLAGLRQAKELVLLGEVISAEEAALLGLVNRVLPPDGLDAFASEAARRLAAGPTRALGHAKRALHRGAESTLGDALAFEALTQAQCFALEDHREGVDAFLEKRDPAFTGR